MKIRGWLARTFGPSRATLMRQNARLTEQRDRAGAERDSARALHRELRDRLRMLKIDMREGRSGIEPHRGHMDHWKDERARTAAAPAIAARKAAGEALGVREAETLLPRIVPPFRNAPPAATITPPADIAFLTVANDRFAPGLEAMLRSLLHLYPDLASDIHVMHDGTLSDFVQRRLTRLYPRLIFRVPDMDWLEALPGQSENHKRIGKLGFMNIEGLALTGYARVLLIDSDLLFLADISELWRGDDAIACLDAGDRDYAVVSPATGRGVLNSGVISLPGSMLGDAAHASMVKLVRETACSDVCETLDRFADQKAWNLWLADKPVRIAPSNYNCNVKFVVKSLDGESEMLSIVHFTGSKPWNDPAWLEPEIMWPDTSSALRHPRLWTALARRRLAEDRLAEYQAASIARRRAPVNGAAGKTCVLIGNGPSIARTDLSLVRGLERFVFNWFVLHDDFDAIAPEHLVIASHQFFGGWNTQAPAFPPGYLAALRSHSHRPVIWASFYFRELFEAEGLIGEYEINWLLFEKPFKRNVDDAGRYDPDLDRFLDDARTGVLTAGLPAALAMGFETVLLVGCDSSYNQAGADTRYFYDQSRHSSKETDADDLTKVWAPGGRGQEVYRLAAIAVAERGGRLVDCTVGGRLDSVEKGDLADFRG